MYFQLHRKTATCFKSYRILKQVEQRQHNVFIKMNAYKFADIIVWYIDLFADLSINRLKLKVIYEYEEYYILVEIKCPVIKHIFKGPESNNYCSWIAFDCVDIRIRRHAFWTLVEAIDKLISCKKSECHKLNKGSSQKTKCINHFINNHSSN